MSTALFNFPPAVRWKKCHFCGEPIRARADGHIEFFSYSANGELGWSGNWNELTIVLAHTDCGPEPAYHFRLDRLVSDGADHWIKHLQAKTWWCYGLEEELRAAEKYAKEMRGTPVEDDPPYMKTILSAKLPRATRSDNPRHITKAMRAYVLERDNFRCRRCNASAVDGARLVIDHVVPVARGGTGDHDNLQTLCWDCNAGKRDREPHPHDLRP